MSAVRTVPAPRLRRADLAARLRAGVSDLLAPAPAAARVGPRQVALGAAAVLVGAAVTLLRQGGAGPLNTLWAEDGQVFLGEAARFGPLHALATSYAGYYHLVPRLLAALALLAPAHAAAAVFAVEAALCTGLVAVFVYVASAGHLSSTLSRLMVSGIVLVIPIAQGDLPNALANLHWYGLYALFWALIWSPRSTVGKAVAAVVVVLVAGSDILVLAYVPLALVRVFGRRRDRFGVLLAALLGIGLAVQFAGLLFGSSSRPLSPNPVRAVVGYVLRAVPAPLVGERWLGSQVGARWVVLAGLAWLVVAAAVVVAWRGRGLRPAWALAVAAFLQSVGLYVLPVLLTGVATPRYAVAPAMLVVTALVALLQPAPGRAGAAWAPLAALAALLAVVCAVNLRVDNARAHGPRWDAELARARAACPAAGTVELPIPPADQTPPWRVRLPCGYVER